MSTQPDSPHHDLDRTDELPRLDVAAYEASMAEKAGDEPDGVRTDTWTTAALRQIDAAEDETQSSPTATTQMHPRPSGSRWPFPPPAPPTPPKTAVTADVDHILKRIAELESELGTAKALNVQLQERCDAVTADRDGQTKLMLGLKADNARLSEHRTIGDEMVSRLEQKLRDQTAHSTAQLTELQSARFDEHLKAEKAREELQQQIAQKAVQLAALQENHAKLREELQITTDLAAERGNSVRELRALLVEEETSAEQLALQLAGKLRESDNHNAALASLNQTITELRAQTDKLGTLLQQEVDKTNLLAAQLDRSQHELADSRAQHNVRDSGVATLQRQLDEVRADLQSSQSNVTALERDLVAVRSTLSDEQNRRHAADEQLGAEKLSSEGLRAGLDFARSQLQELGRERDSLLAASEAAQTESTQLRSETADLKQSLEDAYQTAERLRSEANTHLQLLHNKTAELSAVKTELNQQAPALREFEQAVHARDELIGQLREQLQTTQDEHGIMSGQLQKARQRVKSLAEQIFHRDNQIAALKSDLAVHVEALAAIRRDVSRVDEEPAGQAAAGEPQRVLQPVDHDGDPIVLDRKVITVGRTAENDVCVPSKLISRHHARLLLSPNGVIVEDAGSTNGCFVNGKQVKQQLMREGDILEMGDLKFRLSTPSPNDTRARDNVISFSGKQP